MMSTASILSSCPPPEESSNLSPLPLKHLPFEVLQPFQPVDRQFVDLGIGFTGAVALRPSNPSFLGPHGPGLGLTPSSGNQQVWLHLHRGGVRVRVRGYRPLVVCTYDAQGHPTPTGATYHQQDDTPGAPIHTVTVSGGSVAAVKLSSSAAYFIEAVHLLA